MPKLASYHFNVSTVDEQGHLSLQLIEARSHAHACEIASTLGASVVRCDQVQAISNRLRLDNLFIRVRGHTSIDTVALSQDLATLLDAGVAVKEAINALHRKEADHGRRQILERISISISQGQAFSQALASTSAFPDILIATVAASEETGDLAIGLSRFAKHQESLRTVRDRVAAACIYPLLLLCVGSVVVVLLLGVVVPRFATLIDSTGKELPFLSRALMGWGHLVDRQPWIFYALLIVIVFVIFYIWARMRNSDTRKQLLSHVPGVAKVVREFQHLQMYRTTAILTSRGIAIHKALGYSMEFLGVPDQASLRRALIHMQEGATVSTSMGQSGLSDLIAISMLNVAERTGSMPEMLDRIADFYERTIQRNIDIVSRLIEPLLMIILGVVIGGIVVMMYLPIFDLASSIS